MLTKNELIAKCVQLLYNHIIYAFNFCCFAELMRHTRGNYSNESIAQASMLIGSLARELDRILGTEVSGLEERVTGGIIDNDSLPTRMTYTNF